MSSESAKRPGRDRREVWRDPDTQQIHYLLHSGSEPVLLFAPSRSGKGVSAIIPTLCQWRQSAFVYDLKGENWSHTAGFRHAAKTPDIISAVLKTGF